MFIHGDTVSFVPVGLVQVLSFSGDSKQARLNILRLKKVFYETDSCSYFRSHGGARAPQFLCRLEGTYRMDPAASGTFDFLSGEVGRDFHFNSARTGQKSKAVHFPHQIPHLTVLLGFGNGCFIPSGLANGYGFFGQC